MNARFLLAAGLVAAGGAALGVWWLSGLVPSPAPPMQETPEMSATTERTGRTAAPVRSADEIMGNAKIDRLRAVLPMEVKGDGKVGGPAASLIEPVLVDLRACRAAAAAHDPSVPRDVLLELDVVPLGGGEGEVVRVSSTAGETFDACAGRLLLHGRLAAQQEQTLRIPMSL